VYSGGAQKPKSKRRVGNDCKDGRIIAAENEEVRGVEVDKIASGPAHP